MWKLYAVLEGLTKTVSSIFQKLVGTVMGTVEMGCLAAIVIGGIQMTSGLAGFIKKSRADSRHVTALVPDIRSVMWAILFGFFAGIFGTVLSIYTFTLGADLGVRTLLISFSIVPGAIVGWIIWRDPLGPRQWLGILVFLTAMWAMLGFPTDFGLDAWVWLTLIIACSQVANEMLSRAAGVKLNIWTNNFWVGGSTVFFAMVGLIALTFVKDGLTLDVSKMFAFGTVVIAVIVVAMISFKLLAYQGGGTIALKKIIMPGTYLVSAIFAGVLVWDEPLTLGKFVGMALWFVSIALVDNAVWGVLRARPQPA